VPKVQFICLANSRKLQGRCVAGLRVDGTGWFRPVSTFPDGTLYYNSYVLNNGNEAALLDVVEVDVTRARPEPHQPENWELAQGTWRLVQQIAPASALAVLRSALVPGPVVLENQSDRVANASLQAKPAAASLALVEPSSIKWHITTSLRGNRQTRCSFSVGGAHYNLSVTDLKIEAALSALPVGVYPRDAAGIPAMARVLLTISLGEPFNGDCYKLVAAVLVLP
jgi:hypothetical protein